MADQCEEEIKTALQNNDLPLAAEKALEHLEKLNNVPLTIAITGETGSGKSTLVNALRGIRNNTEGAAPTGAMETTMKPTEYIHPQNDKIRIWDLPGIGTVKFTADKYLEYVDFEKYDFFIIVSDKRFKQNDAKLAQEIQRMKKKFYFVRSQIDNSINSERRSDPNFNEEELLKKIRDHCTKELQKLGCESPKIFLVSGLDLHLYDFEDLWKTLEKELPEHKKNALLLALPNISLDVIEQKKKALGSKIKWYTFMSGAGAVVPVPGLSGTLDLGILVQFTKLCQRSLGLSLESLQKLSQISGVSLEELKAELKSPLAAVEITTALIQRELTMSAAYITATALEERARFIPLVGTPVAVALSCVTTYSALYYILQTLGEDTQRVFRKALGLNTSV